MSKSISIYTTPTCGYCKATKEFLTSKTIEYTEIDVSVNQEKAKEMIEKSGQMGVPVIIIRDGEKEELIVGFDQQRLTQILGL